MTLFTRVFAVNAIVLVGAAAALPLTPATVSFPITPLAFNFAALRTVFRPLARLTGFMRADGVQRVELKRSVSPALRFSETWSWMLEVYCREVEAEHEAVKDGPGLALLADLRLLGMHPAAALVADAD